MTWCFLAFKSSRVLSRLVTGLFACIVGAALVVSNTCNVFVIIMLLRYRRIRQRLLSGLERGSSCGGGAAPHEAGPVPTPVHVRGAGDGMAFAGMHSNHGSNGFGPLLSVNFNHSGRNCTLSTFVVARHVYA